MIKKIALLLLLFSLFVTLFLTGCSKDNGDTISPEGKVIEHVETQIRDETNIVRFGKGDGWEYNVYEDFVEVLEYWNSEYIETIVVPSTIEGLPVRVLDSGFMNFFRVKKIVIPETVVYIKDSYKTYMEHLNIIGGESGQRDSWQDIREFVIEGNQLIKFEEAFTKTEGWKFSYFRLNSWLTNENIQNIIDHIYEKVPAYMFYQCEAVESIVFKENIKSIGKNAFASCENLESVELGNSVVEIKEYAFDTSALRNAIIHNPECVINGHDIFGSRAELYGKSGSTASSYAAQNQLLFNEISE